MTVTRCRFCGATPALSGSHHLHARVGKDCPRYAPHRVSGPYSSTGEHDRCDTLDGADSPDEIAERVRHLEAVADTLVDLVGAS